MAKLKFKIEVESLCQSLKTSWRNWQAKRHARTAATRSTRTAPRRHARLKTKLSAGLQQLLHNPVLNDYAKLWPYAKPYWFRALLAALLCIPVGMLDAAIAFSLKPYMDGVLLTQQLSQRMTWLMPIGIVLFTALQGGLNYFATYLNTWVGNKITNDLKYQLFEKMLTLDCSYFDTNDSGSLLMRFNQDPDSACAAQLERLKNFVKQIVSSCSLIGVLFYNSWQLACITTVVLALSFLPIANIRKRIVGVLNSVVSAGASVMRVYNEAFAGNKIITSYNLDRQQASRFKQVLNSIFRMQIKLVQKTSWLSPIMHVIISIGIGLTIGYGSYLITIGAITTGNFVSFITSLLMLYNPIKNIGSSYSAMQQSLLAIERVFDLLALQPAIQDKPDAIELGADIRSLRFEHVDFAYQHHRDKEHLVLQDFSLEIEPGRVTALVGNSGGGKSTIVNLIPRFYDVTGGGIYINDRDIRDYSLESLRNRIVVVFQDNFLFAGTIRENILYGNMKATEEEIWQAVRLSFLEDFINTLPQGLDTQIGERGLLLSGGQKQRIAIARAFIKNAPIVILDEATSALDNQAEAVVQRAIYNLMKDKTVLIVAHRLSTIRNADRILVLQNGQLVESGSHNDLINIPDGYYSRLYNSQFNKSSVTTPASQPTPA